MIKDFQEKYGLKPDGVIGKKTLQKIKEVLGIATNEELSHFMGQCDHESNCFATLTENLNYSAAALVKIFKHDFDTNRDRVISEVETKKAKELARKPEQIANFVYANQNGNGNEASGEGWKHRGFGPIQLTGKINQYAFSNYIKDPEIKNNPSLIATKYPFESAKYYFDNNNLWKYAKKVDINSITLISKAINVGNIKTLVVPHGLEERIKKTFYYYNLLNS